MDSDKTKRGRNTVRRNNHNSEGKVYEPLRPGDRMYDMLQKFQNLFSGLESRGETMYNSALVDHQKQMEQMANQITNYNNVVNNTKNVQPVVSNEIHVVCPGVTREEVARQLPGVLNQTFSGFSNYTDQMSRIR